MYKYETHLHTSPVSRCARVSVRENLEFYKNLGYDGVFITNHFLDGSININYNTPYEEKINFYFSDYENGVDFGKEIGIKVFCGVETTFMGTDFLVYGLKKEWFLEHPEIMDLEKKTQLSLMKESGAFIVQAHPFREASYIDHIRLFPQSVDGVEIINGNCSLEQNDLAKIYAEHYGLIKLAGSDNHRGANQKVLAGITTQEPITSVEDFIRKAKTDQIETFSTINL